MLSRSRGLLFLLLAGLLAAALPLVTTPDSISADFTGLTSPTADIAYAGDGFEVTPFNAYADDSLTAQNIDGAGDSHLYYNYGFNIPAGATIKGIEVRLDWYLDSDNGTNSMSVDLSWNNTSNWTSALTDNVESTVEHTTVLGGPTDTWGRAWNPNEFSNSNFRVRVTCNSDDLARDFYLDWVAVNIYYAPVAWLEVSGSGTMSAGSTNQLTITAKDNEGNVAVNYNGAKILVFSGPSIAPGGQIPTVGGVPVGNNLSVTFSNGVSVLGATPLVAYRAETTTVDVNNGTISSYGSTAYDLDLTISPAAATRLEVTGMSTMVAGTTNEITLAAKDPYGNTDTTYTGLKSLTFSGPGIAPGGQIPTVEGVNIGIATAVSFTNGVSAAGTATLAAYRAEPTTVDVTDGTIDSYGSTAYDLDLTVNPGVVAQLDLTPNGGSATSGVPFTVTVTAQDAYLNVATSYAGTVNFASTDGSATLPPNYTFATGDNGVHTFTNGVTLITAGNQSVTVTDTINATLTNSETWTVGAATAARLEVTGSPTMMAGTTNELTITARDASGNIDTTYTGLKSLTFSGPVIAPGGQIPTIEGVNIGIAVSVNFTNGVSDVNAVTLVAYRAEATIVEATDGVIVSTGYGLILTISPTPTTRLDLTPDGGLATSGVPFTVTVTAQDPYLNVTPGYASTVSFLSSDNGTGVVLPGPYLFGASDNGTHTYTNGVTLVTAGDQTLTAGDGLLSDTATWTVAASATVDHIIISPVATTIVAGDNLTYTVEAFDMFNNSLGDVTSSTVFSIDPAAGGSWAANIYISQYTGPWTVTGDYGGIVGTASLTVQAGSASSIVITPDSSTLPAGSSVTYTAQAFDQYNNSLGDVTTGTAFSIDILAGGTWFNNVYTSQYAGTWTVTGSYSGLTDGDSLTVTAGPATSVVVTPATATLTAGGSLTYTAQATDQFNNALGDVSSSTSFSIDPGAGGSWLLNVYTSQYAGTWTVTGDYTGIVGTASLTVSPGVFDHYTVVSDNYSQQTSIAFTVTVTAFDAYGNVMTTDNTTIITMTSSSSSMIFDGNDNGLFGEPGDNVKTLSAGTLDILAKDNTATDGITITASDGSVQAVSSTYTIENFRCFIATAAYGTPMAREIEVLRDFRDRYLVTNPPGRLFVSIYYKLSPPVARFIAQHDSLRACVRFGLTPVLWLASTALKSTIFQKLTILALLLATAVIAVIYLQRSRRTGTA